MRRTLIIIYFDTFYWVFTYFISNSYGQNQCYEGNCGPSDWQAPCQFGSDQSPINIIPQNLTRGKVRRNLIFSTTYSDLREFQMENTGNTIRLSETLRDVVERPLSTLRIRGAGMNETYAFLEMHFHWGSEHMYRGTRYPLELHIVHEQLSRSGGLHVLSIIYGLKQRNSIVLTPITERLSDITQVSPGPVTLTNFNLSRLLPPTWDVFRYQGEQTNSPCSQIIMWSVFTQRMPISQTQLNGFLAIQNTNGVVIGNNYRPIQPTFTNQRRNVYWMPVNKTRSISQRF